MDFTDSATTYQTSGTSEANQNPTGKSKITPLANEAASTVNSTGGCMHNRVNPLDVGSSLSRDDSCRNHRD